MQASGSAAEEPAAEGVVDNADEDEEQLTSSFYEIADRLPPAEAADMQKARLVAGPRTGT